MGTFIVSFIFELFEAVFLFLTKQIHLHKERNLVAISNQKKASLDLEQ